VRDHARVLEAISRDLGAVDCLVNDAGVSVRQRGDLLEVSLDSYDRCFDVNTRGTFFWTQAVARGMAATPAPPGRHRSIVFVTSSNAVAASVERGEYCMSKTALSMAAKLFAIRMAPHGVGVYEVQPGIILTAMTEPSKDEVRHPHRRRAARGAAVGDAGRRGADREEHGRRAPAVHGRPGGARRRRPPADEVLSDGAVTPA
jgi:NAD(P)-dependent dehydrogenase (short-subunit alcohol dehydrogenase family)